MSTQEQTKREQAKWIYETVNILRSWVLSNLAAPEEMSGDTPMLELTPAQMSLIQTLERCGEATIKDLARMLAVSAPSVSAMVDRLVELGAVTREQHPRDRRVVVVRPTPEALATVRYIEERLYDSIEYLLERVGPETSRKWCEVYEEILRVIEKESSVSVKACEGKETQP